MDKPRLIDADKVILKLSNTIKSIEGTDEEYTQVAWMVKWIIQLIESGVFDPDPIPLPTIKPGGSGMNRDIPESLEGLRNFWSDINNLENTAPENVQSDILAYLRWIEAEKERADKATEEYRYALMVKEDFVKGYHIQEERAKKAEAREQKLKKALPINEWHEDIGSVLWWEFPISEPPYCGTPLDLDWPDYHKHWTTIVVPEREDTE